MHSSGTGPRGGVDSPRLLGWQISPRTCIPKVASTATSWRLSSKGEGAGASCRPTGRRNRRSRATETFKPCSAHRQRRQRRRSPTAHTALLGGARGPRLARRLCASLRQTRCQPGGEGLQDEAPVLAEETPQPGLRANGVGLGKLALCGELAQNWFTGPPVWPRNASPGQIVVHRPLPGSYLVQTNNVWFSSFCFQKVWAGWASQHFCT